MVSWIWNQNSSIFHHLLYFAVYVDSFPQLFFDLFIFLNFIFLWDSNFSTLKILPVLNLLLMYYYYVLASVLPNILSFLFLTFETYRKLFWIMVSRFKFLKWAGYVLFYWVLYKNGEEGMKSKQFLFCFLQTKTFECNIAQLSCLNCSILLRAPHWILSLLYRKEGRVIFSS